MPLVTKCPHCNEPSQVAEEHAGKQVRCPKCKAVFVAPLARAPVGVPASGSAGGGSTMPSLPTRPPVTPAPPPSRPVAVPPASATRSGTTSTDNRTPTVTTPPTANAARPPVPSVPAAPKGAAPPRKPTPGATADGDFAVCPACKSKMPVGATHCLDCGWSQVPSEGVGGAQPILCINPACGVANPPNERYCQRCNSLLPTAAGTMLQGRYQIELLLAEGGFGRVYKGKDVQTRQPVAIKDMICLDPDEFSIRLNFFRREAEILRELAGLEIVPKIFDFVQQGQSAHLIMEFIPGDTLQKILENNNNRPFPTDLVIEWGIKICRVLEVMHSRTPPIIHRDVKPDNIMLLQDGRNIKLIDFGTARDLTHSFKGRNPRLTRVFTEGYAPPEQIVGKPEARSDLFALAATMYHLVTGEAPEGFYTARQLEARLKDANGRIPDDQRWLFELLRINLAESVNDRYYSAAEIRRDLEQRRLTTQVVCPKCQHVNRVREPYCGGCAAVLTQPGSPCQQCGKTNALGSRFCIHCAHRLG